MFADKTIREFLDEAASSAPTPGGGSVAALTGALGAALLSMVCNLTVGKEKYRDVEPDILRLLSETETLRKELLELLEADVQAYGKLSAAMKMPRATDDEKKARTAALQEALVTATNVPLDIARRCSRVVELAMPVAEKGNVNAVSDAGVGVLLGEAALHAALLNVKINLGLIKDHEFVDKAKRAMAECTEGKPELKDKVMALVNQKLEG